MDAYLLDFINRHDRIVLMFSAGKDSAACLDRVRPWLDKIMVTWVNPGNPYPETVEYMARIYSAVPHFQVVTGKQPAFIEAHGYPADLIPFESMPVGRIATRQNTDAPKLVPVEECCGANLWTPALKALHDYRATGCIRGDKSCDPLRSDISSGDIRDGVEFHFPLWDWTDERVIEYLGDDLPPSYRRGLRTSLDCINCTAYVADNPGRLADLRERHPSTWAEVQPVVHWMRDVTRRHLAALEKL